MRAIAAVAACAALTAVTAGASGPAAPQPPLLGMNYIRFEESPPSCGGPPIILHYHEVGVRRLVRAQLAAMRAGGMRALRLFIYHSSRGGGSLVPSASGRLEEPYRGNLAGYLDDVRAAGFTSLTLTFNPWEENDPVGYTSVPYDPSKLDENWRFIADVRPIAKQHGPATTRIDLINEGAPENWQPGLRAYVKELWRRYAAAFGTEDAIVSVILNEYAGTRRLANLVALIRETGSPMPAVFQVHLSWSENGSLRDLGDADALLDAQGLDQPFVVGEEAYDAPGPARGIAAFVRSGRRPVLEVMAWPLATPGSSWKRCPSAPYRADAYARALGRAAFRLEARVDAAGAALVAAGTSVTALGAGTYDVAVTDRSPRDGFVLRMNERTLRTTRRFHGTARWRIRLGEGALVRWGSVRRGIRAHVIVLGNGWSH